MFHLGFDSSMLLSRLTRSIGSYTLHSEAEITSGRALGSGRFSGYKSRTYGYMRCVMVRQRLPDVLMAVRYLLQI